MNSTLIWRKSSYCANGTCVEIADEGGGSNWYLRDGKNPDLQPIEFTRGQWAAFMTDIRSGALDRL